jgi:hypothetical protein
MKGELEVFFGALIRILTHHYQNMMKVTCMMIDKAAGVRNQIV